MKGDSSTTSSSSIFCDSELLFVFCDKMRDGMGWGWRIRRGPTVIEKTRAGILHSEGDQDHFVVQVVEGQFFPLLGSFLHLFPPFSEKKKSRKTPPFLLIRPLVITQPTPTHPSPGRSLRAPHPSVCQIEGGGEFDFLLREGEGIFLLWGGFNVSHILLFTMKTIAM